MVHFFDVDVAVKYGVDCAVIFQNIGFWVEHNMENGRNYFDGQYWTYNSSKAFETFFPYMSYQKIGRSLTKLEDAGLIASGSYNSSPFDRTKWYTLTEVGYAIFKNDNSHLSNLINREITGDKPIPDINNTYISTNINKELSVSKDTDCQTEVRQNIQKAVDAWNFLEQYGYSKISRMSSSSQRYKSLKARILEFGIDDVLKAIENVGKSSYLKDQVWFSFDWFVKPNNFPKVLEGKYNKGSDSTEQKLKRVVPEEPVLDLWVGD